MGRYLQNRCSRKHLSLLSAVASIFCLGCPSFPAPPFASRSPIDRAVQEDDIRESVFRYRMDHPHRDGPFFLSIDGKDPSGTFMARFANVDRKVKKTSQSYFKKDPPPGWLRDRSTDEQGVWFSVGAISWLSPERVEVGGGMYCGGLCADAGKYRMEKKQGHWVVVEYKVEMIS